MMMEARWQTHRTDTSGIVFHDEPAVENDAVSAGAVTVRFYGYLAKNK